MARSTYFITLALAVSGCAPSDRPMPSAPERTERLSPERDHQTIRVGQALDDAHNMVLASGAEEITDSVGILTDSSQVMRWYLLKGNTCVCVVASPVGMPERLFVQSLTLGEDGSGYGGKVEWFAQQQRQVNQLDLR